MKYISENFISNKWNSDPSDARRQYYLRNREKWRNHYNKKSRELREEIINLMGGKCIKCGFIDIRALQIDHINGGGTKIQREFGNRELYYRYILSKVKNGEWIGFYQVLCANCNTIKREESKECQNTHGKYGVF